MNRFAANLTELMKRRRMSQRQLADAVGISQAMVSRWVRGENNPDFEQAAKIAEAFQVTVDMLILADLGKVADREIELRRALARAVETVGIEEAIRRILVAGSRPEGTAPMDVETVPKKPAVTKKPAKGQRGAG